jgi:coiled-coil domain-containing protein 55
MTRARARFTRRRCSRTRPCSSTTRTTTRTSDARLSKQREADEERVDRKSRYVETLMKRRDEREREDAVLKERRLVREREREDHLYGDKEKFVTAAYKKKLEKDEQWLAEEKARDDAEARDVAKARESGFGFDAIRRSALESAGGPRAGQKEDANAGTAEPTEPSEPTEQEKRRKEKAKGDETTTRADEELVAPRRSSADAAKSSPRASVEARDSPPVLAAEPAAVARDSAPVANRGRFREGAGRARAVPGAETEEGPSGLVRRLVRAFRRRYLRRY